MSEHKNAFDVLDLIEKYLENAHEHELKIRFDLENIIHAARKNEKKRHISLAVMKHIQQFFNSLLKKFQISLSFTMMKKLRVEQRKQQQLIESHAKLITQLKEIKNRTSVKIIEIVLFASEMINDVVAFKHRLVVKLKDTTIMIARKITSNEDTCANVNKTIKANFTITNFFDRLYKKNDR